LLEAALLEEGGRRKEKEGGRRKEKEGKRVFLHLGDAPPIEIVS